MPSMQVDIRPFDITDKNAVNRLFQTALHFYNVKFKREGLSMVVDFEHGLINFANEKECQITDNQELYYYLENIGYDILFTSATAGKVMVY